jgi:DNA-binding MarR family transcriptional regulator
MARYLSGTDTEKVYEFIKQYIADNGGRPPTQREIADGCYIARSSVQRHLDILDARGLIVREMGMARGLTLVLSEDEEK